VHRSHARVVGALASGNPERAAAAMQEHLREAQGLLGSRDAEEAGGAADLAIRRAGASQPGRRTR
jgi:DNA-binding GntR family transcriptional regulator